MKVILLLAAMAATAFGEQTCYQGWDMHVRYFHRLSHTLLKAAQRFNIFSGIIFYLLFFQ